MLVSETLITFVIRLIVSLKLVLLIRDSNPLFAFGTDDITSVKEFKHSLTGEPGESI
jgi:hypothetical protein